MEIIDNKCQKNQQRSNLDIIDNKCQKSERRSKLDIADNNNLGAGVIVLGVKLE